MDCGVGVDCGGAHAGGQGTGLEAQMVKARSIVADLGDLVSFRWPAAVRVRTRVHPRTPEISYH